MEQYDRCVERRLCTLANRCEHLEQRKNRLYDKMSKSFVQTARRK
jgi:hypothetical protein